MAALVSCKLPSYLQLKIATFQNCLLKLQQDALQEKLLLASYDIEYAKANEIERKLKSWLITQQQNQENVNNTSDKSSHTIGDQSAVENEVSAELYCADDEELDHRKDSIVTEARPTSPEGEYPKKDEISVEQRKEEPVKLEGDDRTENLIIKKLEEQQLLFIKQQEELSTKISSCQESIKLLLSNRTVLGDPKLKRVWNEEAPLHSASVQTSFYCSKHVPERLTTETIAVESDSLLLSYSGLSNLEQSPHHPTPIRETKNVDGNLTNDVSLGVEISINRESYDDSLFQNCESANKQKNQPFTPVTNSVINESIKGQIKNSAISVDIPNAGIDVTIKQGCKSFDLNENTAPLKDCDHVIEEATSEKLDDDTDIIITVQEPPVRNGDDLQESHEHVPREEICCTSVDMPNNEQSGHNDCDVASDTPTLKTELRVRQIDFNTEINFKPNIRRNKKKRRKRICYRSPKPKKYYHDVRSVVDKTRNNSAVSFNYSKAPSKLASCFLSQSVRKKIQFTTLTLLADTINTMPDDILCKSPVCKKITEVKATKRRKDREIDTSKCPEEGKKLKSSIENEMTENVQHVQVDHTNNGKDIQSLAVSCNVLVDENSETKSLSYAKLPLASEMVNTSTESYENASQSESKSVGISTRTRNYNKPKSSVTTGKTKAARNKGPNQKSSLTSMPVVASHETKQKYKSMRQKKDNIIQEHELKVKPSTKKSDEAKINKTEKEASLQQTYDLSLGSTSYHSKLRSSKRKTKTLEQPKLSRSVSKPGKKSPMPPPLSTARETTPGLVPKESVPTVEESIHLNIDLKVKSITDILVVKPLDDIAKENADCINDNTNTTTNNEPPQQVGVTILENKNKNMGHEGYGLTNCYKSYRTRSRANKTMTQGHEQDSQTMSRLEIIESQLTDDISVSEMSNRPVKMVTVDASDDNNLDTMEKSKIVRPMTRSMLARTRETRSANKSIAKDKKEEAKALSKHTKKSSRETKGLRKKITSEKCIDDSVSEEHNVDDSVNNTKSNYQTPSSKHAQNSQGERKLNKIACANNPLKEFNRQIDQKICLVSKNSTSKSQSGTPTANELSVRGISERNLKCFGKKALEQANASEIEAGSGERTIESNLKNIEKEVAETDKVSKIRADTGTVESNLKYIEKEAAETDNVSKMEAGTGTVQSNLKSIEEEAAEQDNALKVKAGPRRSKRKLVQVNHIVNLVKDTVLTKKPLQEKGAQRGRKNKADRKTTKEDKETKAGRKKKSTMPNCNTDNLQEAKQNEVELSLITEGASKTRKAQTEAIPNFTKEGNRKSAANKKTRNEEKSVVQTQSTDDLHTNMDIGQTGLMSSVPCTSEIVTISNPVSDSSNSSMVSSTQSKSSIAKETYRAPISEQPTGETLEEVCTKLKLMEDQEKESKSIDNGLICTEKSMKGGVKKKSINMETAKGNTANTSGVKKKPKAKENENPAGKTLRKSNRKRQNKSRTGVGTCDPIEEDKKENGKQDMTNSLAMKKRRTLFNSKDNSLMTSGFYVLQDTMNGTAAFGNKTNTSAMPPTLAKFLKNFVAPKLKRPGATVPVIGPPKRSPKIQ